MTILRKILKAINPNSQPINPPADSASKIVNCGIKTFLPVGNYDHSGLDQMQQDANNYILRDDPYRYSMLNENMLTNMWHQD